MGQRQVRATSANGAALAYGGRGVTVMFVASSCPVSSPVHQKQVPLF